MILNLQPSFIAIVYCIMYIFKFKINIKKGGGLLQWLTALIAFQLIFGREFYLGVAN